MRANGVALDTKRLVAARGRSYNPRRANHRERPIHGITQ